MYKGRISDVGLIEKSDFLSFIEEGDIVLSDRGFVIDNMLAKKGATIKLPAFLRGKKALSLKDATETKIIAKARIHVERFNERLKNYKFFDRKIPQNQFPMLSQAVLVACCLVNFQKPLAN